MKAISTKRTTVKMCLFHSNTRVKHDFHLWVHELLMRLKTNQAANTPYSKMAVNKLFFCLHVN